MCEYTVHHSYTIVIKKKNNTQITTKNLTSYVHIINKEVRCAVCESKLSSFFFCLIVAIDSL